MHISYNIRIKQFWQFFKVNNGKEDKLITGFMRQCKCQEIAIVKKIISGYLINFIQIVDEEAVTTIQSWWDCT